MLEFKAWCPDDGGEEKADDCFGYINPKKAAEDFARDRWKRAGEPWEQTIYVREADGRMHIFIVTAEVKPVFKAEEYTSQP